MVYIPRLLSLWKNEYESLRVMFYGLVLWPNGDFIIEIIDIDKGFLIGFAMEGVKPVRKYSEYVERAVARLFELVSHEEEILEMMDENERKMRKIIVYVASGSNVKVIKTPEEAKAFFLDP